MKKSVFVAACALLAGCCGSHGSDAVKGAVIDATMNTVMIVTADGDTLSFSTVNADRTALDGLFVGDTVEVRFKGKYEQGMEAAELLK